MTKSDLDYIYAGWDEVKNKHTEELKDLFTPTAAKYIINLMEISYNTAINRMLKCDISNRLLLQNIRSMGKERN